MEPKINSKENWNHKYAPTIDFQKLTCLTVTKTSLSVFVRSLKRARSRTTLVYEFFVTFSLISKLTLNSYIAEVKGFPIKSDVIDPNMMLLLSTAELVTLHVRL